MQIVKITSILICCFLLLVSASLVQGQSHYVPIATFDYEGAPLFIIKPQLLYIAGEGMRIYCDVENTGDKDIISYKIWLLLYYEKQDDPTLIEYSSTDTIPAGQSRNIIDWYEPDNGNIPIEGLLVPLFVEMPDLTTWRLRDYYAIKGINVSELVTGLTFPEVANVTIIEDDIGLINSGTFRDLHEGQRLGVVRYSEDSIEKIAQIRLLKTLPTRSGFVVDYVYPDQEIQSSDRVQLLFPGLTRLNATAKSLGLVGGLSLASAEFFHLWRERDKEKINNTDDDAEKLMLSKRIKDNKKRIDAALVSAGITLGGALLSEVLWSRHGEPLYSPGFGLRPYKWNTTTRTFLTIGASAIGAGAYYAQQKNNSVNIMNSTLDSGTYQKYHGKSAAARRNRDAAYILAGTAICTGILNQLCLDNTCEIANPEEEYVVRQRNFISKTFLIMGGTSLSAAAFFTYQKSQDNESRKKAETIEEQQRFEQKMIKHRDRRDAALVIAGSSIITSAIAQFWFNKYPGDEFFDKPMFSLPEMPKVSWYLTGLAAASAGAAFNFHDIVKYARTRYNNATELGVIRYYRNKVEKNEDRRQLALITAGASAGGAVLSYFIFRDKFSGEPRLIGGGENTESRRITWYPHFDPINASIGITFRF